MSNKKKDGNATGGVIPQQTTTHGTAGEGKQPSRDKAGEAEKKSKRHHDIEKDKKKKKKKDREKKHHDKEKDKKKKKKKTRKEEDEKKRKRKHDKEKMLTLHAQSLAESLNEGTEDLRHTLTQVRNPAMAINHLSFPLGD